MAWEEKNHVLANGPGPFFPGTVSLTSWDGQVGQTGTYGASANRPTGATGADFCGLMIAFGSSRPTFVQTAKSATAATGLTSSTVTFAAANTAGNQLLLDVCWQANNAGQEIISVSDSAGNTWAQACLIRRGPTLATGGISNSYLQTWYCANAAAAGPITVTVSEVGGGQVFKSVCMIVSEYANLGTPAPLPLWQPSTVYALAATITDPYGHTDSVTSIGVAPHQSGTNQPLWSVSGGGTADGNLGWTDGGAGTSMDSHILRSVDADPLNIQMNSGPAFLHLAMAVFGGGSATIAAPTLSNPSGGVVPSTPAQPPGNQPTQPFFANLSPPPLTTPIIDQNSQGAFPIGTPFQNRDNSVPSGDVQQAWSGWFNAVYQFLQALGAAGGAGSLGASIITASYTAGVPDTGRILALNASTAQTFTLPSQPPNGIWNIFVQNIGTGAWTIDPNGLTINNVSGSFTLNSGMGFYLSTDGANYFIETGGGGATSFSRKYTTSWTSQTSVTVTHNLNSTAVLVQVFDASGVQAIPETVTTTSANVVTLTFGASFTGSVVVIG